MKTLIKNFIIFISIVIVLFFVISFIGNYSLLYTYSLDTANCKHIKIADSNINYREFGTNGSPILFIHDFLESSKDFEYIAKKLSSSHKVIAVDMIGFGLSDKSPTINYSRKNISSLCHNFMATLGYTNYSILGHSMGGEIALNMTLDFPNNIDKLILVNSKGYVHIDKNFISNTLVEPLILNYPTQLLSYCNNFFKKDKLNYSIFEENLYNNLSIDSDTLDKILKNNDSGFRQTNIKDINKSTLILWGTKDTVVPLDCAYKFHKDITNSTLVFMENCGHFPFLESPDLFINEITNFLS